MSLEMVFVPILLCLALTIAVSVHVECSNIRSHYNSEVPRMVMYLALTLFGVASIMYLFLDKQ